MSIAVMDAVFKRSESEGLARLVLLALADSCDDYGRCFPGLKSISAKCKVSESTVKRSIKELEGIGEIEVKIGAGLKTVNGATNLYQVRLSKEGVQPERGSNRQGVLEPRGGGSRLTSDPSVLKPSLDINKEGNRLPSEEECKTYAVEIEISQEDGSAFYDHHQARGWKMRGQPMRDYKAALRTWKRYRAHYLPENAPQSRLIGIPPNSSTRGAKIATQAKAAFWAHDLTRILEEIMENPQREGLDLSTKKSLEAWCRIDGKESVLGYARKVLDSFPAPGKVEMVFLRHMEGI